MKKKPKDLNQLSLDFRFKNIDGEPFIVSEINPGLYLIYGKYARNNFAWPQSLQYKGKRLWFKGRVNNKSLSVKAQAEYVEQSLVDIEHDENVLLSFTSTYNKYPFNYWLDLPYHQLQVYFRTSLSTDSYFSYTKLDTLVVSNITMLPTWTKRRIGNLVSFVKMVEEVAKKRKMKYVVMENVNNEKLHHVLEHRYDYKRSTEPYHEHTVLIKEVGEP